MSLVSTVKLLEVAKKNYLLAKVACDLVKERLDRANAPIHKAYEEGKITEDRWAKIVTDNEFNLGYDRVRDYLRKAGDSLIEVAKEGLKLQSKPEQWAKLEPVFTCKFERIREKVLDLSLRWSGE